jgi:hypothetical protein
MRLPKLNTLVEVTWWDIVGLINDRLSRLKPQRCVTTGRLLRVEAEYIVIATSIYEGEGEDPTIDGCAIPLGCIEGWKRLRN